MPYPYGKCGGFRLMENMEIYNLVAEPPGTALKEIKGGRISGMTDINPMWRIKELTKLFGICGIGWKPVPKRFWLENGANDEISAFCEIELFVKVDGEWSDGIPGIGGSSFVAKERNGLYTSDECFKMAFTDAISVACKLLGFAANIYWDKDGESKYSRDESRPAAKPQKQESASKQDLVCTVCGTNITAAAATFSQKKFGKALCLQCQQKENINAK